MTNWTLSPWAEKIKWGSLTGSIKPPSGIFQIRIAPSSQEVATRELSKGSKSKSKTVVPLIKTGTTPSGILPGLLVSKMANLPPGPIKWKRYKLNNIFCLSAAVNDYVCLFILILVCFQIEKAFLLFRILQIISKFV